MAEVGNVVCRAAAGDEVAWEQLVAQYGGLLRSIATHFRMTNGDAEDAAQMTWLGLVQNVSRIRVPEGTTGWLATTMRRNCIRVMRQRQREQPRSDWTQWSIADGSGSSETRLLIAERDRILWESVDRLPTRQRQLVRNLFAGNERSYSDVAAMMSMAIGTIGPARQRALRRLERLLAESGVHRTDRIRA